MTSGRDLRAEPGLRPRRRRFAASAAGAFAVLVTVALIWSFIVSNTSNPAADDAGSPGAAADASADRFGDPFADPPMSAFDPGELISDDSFYNADAMTTEQVQTFLDGRDCRAEAGVTCVATYREDTTDQPDEGPGHCDAYRGRAEQSASSIITHVAHACRISPRVLLVLLQKEQSLLTRPTERGYLRATGYGCPDTADCDAAYFGFFNQVYNAAWQFRQYTLHAKRRYHVGSVRIAFHPDSTCGSTVVRVANQATANLYNYTPYQPSPATLDSPDEAIDDCSTYGNLNFWRLYSRWFGDPRAERFPGFFEPCARLVDGVGCREPDVADMLGFDRHDRDDRGDRSDRHDRVDPTA